MQSYSHDEEQEQSYPCAYYVQSPSTVSHANSTDIRNTAMEDQSAVTLHFHSPTTSESKNPDVSRFTLSRYSSRGSNNSFLHHKGGFNRLIIIDNDEEEGSTEGCWWRYCSFRSSNSCAWISLQISWRIVFSLLLALLVFYIATKPPPPNISINVARVGEFGLAEGVDRLGVTTKILTCNCSIGLLVENKSKLFGLHIHPPTMDLFFGRLPFAISRGPKLYVQSADSIRFEVYVGTRNKPMYGVGRSMQDLLESAMGLPLVIRLRLRSDF